MTRKKLRLYNAEIHVNGLICGRRQPSQGLDPTAFPRLYKVSETFTDSIQEHSKMGVWSNGFQINSKAMMPLMQPITFLLLGHKQRQKKSHHSATSWIPTEFSQ